MATRLSLTKRTRSGRQTESDRTKTNRKTQQKHRIAIGPRQANLVLIAYASSEGSGEPAHPRGLTRTSAARSYKQ